MVEGLLQNKTQIYWQFADPFDTQTKDCKVVPKEPGAFLWMRRREPGPYAARTDDVLFVGTSRNLRSRLYSLSSITAGPDTTLQRVFDVIIAPAVRADLLKQIIVERKSLPIAQMWIRDHVVFGFAPLQAFLPYFDPESFEFNPIGPPPNPTAALTHIAHTLVNILQPWLNTNPTWTALGDTSHEDHDITLPITPRPPSHQWASEQQAEV